MSQRGLSSSIKVILFMTVKNQKEEGQLNGYLKNWLPIELMISLFKKELSFYFNNPIGYIIAILFSVFAQFLFIKDLFLRGDSSMRPFFDLLPWLFLIFVPALSMRMFAEE